VKISDAKVQSEDFTDCTHVYFTENE